MYYTNIANEELQYFHGLKVPNFTIKLSDVLHKTSNVFDNKLFKVEEIITDKLYRIYPLFYTGEIYSTNNDDKIIDNKAIIANKTTSTTYLTFISNEEEEVQDYTQYGAYYTIGETLTDAEFNSIIALLRHNITHNDTLKLEDNTIIGEYGVYEIAINNSIIYLDNGIEKTNTIEISCKLKNPVFSNSKYTLKMNAIHIDDINITGEISDNNITIIPLETELTPGTAVNVDLSDLEQGDVISYDATVEVSHDQPIIIGTWVDDIILSSDKTELDLNESATITATVKDNKGTVMKNKAVKFYNGSTLLDTVNTDNSGVATYTFSSNTNGTYTLTAVADNYTSTGLVIVVGGVTPVTPASIALTSNKDVLSYYDSESATLTATVTGSDSNPYPGATVSIKVYDSTGTTLKETLTVTDVGDGTYTASYSSKGEGDLYIKAECMNLQETYTIEDCLISLLPETTITNNSGTKISSIGLDTIPNIQNTNFSFEFDSQGNGVLNIGAKNQWSSSSANYRATIGYADGKNYWSTRTTSTTEGYGSNASTSTEYHYKIEREGTNVRFYVDDTLIQTRTVSFLTNYSTWSIYSIIWGSGTQKVKNIKLKPL